MGRNIIWDGRGLPDIGDEVLFEVASTPVVQVGTVERFEVHHRTKEKHDSHAWRIEVHMKCTSGKYTWPQMRFLEDVRPLTFRKDAP